MPSRRNLVVPRVGRNSLHPTWLTPTRPRNWDLMLCPFQDVATAPGAEIASSDVIVGPKWAGLRQMLNAWDGWREYDYIWLPDDDVFASQQAIDRLFEMATALEFDLCAPALHEASYYAHYTTMRNHRFTARRTGFVEIMVPCFSRRALEQLLPTLDLTPTGWGWGLDSLWPKLLDYRGVGMIDDVSVLHTRPVGMFRDEALGRAVHAESDRIMAQYDCRQVHTTFEAIGPDLRSMALSPEALTAALVDGWRYLFTNSPEVLPWIVAAQAPSSGWPGYPVEGRPSAGAA